MKEVELKPLKECINKDLYEMYQDIPKEEIGSINNLYGLSYENFILECKKLVDEEKIINKDLGTTTNRYILIDEIPIGSQIYYKIRLSKRNKGYGNIILNLALKEAKKLGFKKIRINCDDNNIASKKIILNNVGKVDIKIYKTKDGTSSSYIIEV